MRRGGGHWPNTAPSSVAPKTSFPLSTPPPPETLPEYNEAEFFGLLDPFGDARPLQKKIIKMIKEKNYNIKMIMEKK